MNESKAFIIWAIFLIWQFSLLIAFWPALKQTAKDIRFDWQNRKKDCYQQKFYYVYYDL